MFHCPTTKSPKFVSKLQIECKKKKQEAKYQLRHYARAATEMQVPEYLNMQSPLSQV